MDATLISEGIESQDKKWKFYTSEAGKVRSTPQGRFIAEQQGTLHYMYWPTVDTREGITLDPAPHITHPVPSELIQEFMDGLTSDTADVTGAWCEIGTCSSYI